MERETKTVIANLLATQKEIFQTEVIKCYEIGKTISEDYTYLIVE